jgi:hypothetical protein
MTAECWLRGCHDAWQRLGTGQPREMLSRRIVMTVVGTLFRNSATGRHGIVVLASGRYCSTIERMLPSGSLNQTPRISPMVWMSPSRVVPGRSS